MATLFFGRRLSNREQGTRKLGWFEAVPAMGLDGLGSASYGPEAALTILMPLGAASLAWIGWVMAPIVVLLAILYLSYRQTIVAYPSNGGAYTVARENLGRNASLLAAASLMVDYILNVAVGISAGVGALSSSIPALQPWTLTLCLVVLALVTMANLRGTPEAGWLFALPTYVFVVSFLGLLVAGLWAIVVTGGHPHPVVAAPHLGDASGAIGVWLFMRAFASGCTAMTGVEAVSNGVSAFKEPVIGQARKTLAVICLVLGLLLGGIAIVAHFYAVGAMDQTKPDYQSVLSQLTAAIAGRGVVYYVAMASLLAVLSLSANTSFVDFPRMCRIVAQDGYLPRAFAVADRRLVFSVGIFVLTVAAGGLLILFGGITDRLIPLFAIGAFLTFSMSQIGMVVHWRRQGRGHAGRLTINALGAGTTVVAVLVILAAKFIDGAWITVLAIPTIIVALYLIHLYYDKLDASLQCSAPFTIEEADPPTILVAVEGRNRMTDQALQFAMTLSPDVIAIHLLRVSGPDTDDDGKRLKEQWQTDIVAPLETRGTKAPRLMLLPAPYREMHEPLLKFIARLDEETPGRSVAVMIPEAVKRRWWEYVLHTNRGARLHRMLLKHGNARVKVVIAPWRPDQV
ncbi:APC family permease [Acidisphaera sp. L21]|uniref:APC family permease n=1 Tax=Acidisphaera sp. L21 TaxID=1641851 RepID=UPI001C20A3D9|nr:APC family permease [Acidisphaera sp. L21]